MKRRILFAVTGALLLFTPFAWGTNGMNMEGYGPIAQAMGGASLAHENGTAATMNNPATLSMAAAGLHLDLAVGLLGPDVKATVMTPNGAMTAESSADAFYMPAFGIYCQKESFGVGLGVFSQGGMGTQYENDSWMADPSMGQNTALTEGMVNRSEVGVGRAILPLTYKVNEQFSIGGSVDFVWASMDLQMAMSEAQFQDLANPAAQTIGSASGTLVGAFGSMYEPFGGTGIQKLHHAYFDFTDDSDFTGQATGTGFAGKLGLLFQPTPELSVGATYHSKTSLSDLEADEADMVMGVNIDPGVLQGNPTGTYQDMMLPVAGSIAIKDFEWPAVMGLGVAFQATPKLLLAADVKQIQWADVMKDFTMVFTASDAATNGGFVGLEMEATLFQEWDDQMVIGLGAAFEATEDLTLRAGFNHGANPIPDDFLNALFPAIVESHLTFGAGYTLGEHSALALSVVSGFESEQTNPGNGTTMPEVTSAHKQLNAQLMYTHHF